MSNQFYSTRLPFREDCLSHETYPAPIELPLGHAQTVAELFAAARPTLAGRLTLVLDRDLVTGIDCPRCGWHLDVYRPLDVGCGTGNDGSRTLPAHQRAGSSEGSCRIERDRSPGWSPTRPSEQRAPRLLFPV